MATLGTVFSSPPAGWVGFESHGMELSGFRTSSGSGYSGNMLIYSYTLGATAIIKGVKGTTGLRLIGGNGNVGATADVYLNDIKVGAITLGASQSAVGALCFELMGLDVDTEYTLKIVMTSALYIYLDAVHWAYTYTTQSTPAVGWTRIINSNTSVLKYSSGVTQFIYNGGWSGNHIAALVDVGSSVSFHKPIKGITGIKLIGYANRNNISPRNRTTKADVYLNGVYHSSFSTVAPVQINYFVYCTITGLDVNTEYNIEIRNVVGDSCVIDSIDLQTSETLMLAGLSRSLVEPESGWLRHDDTNEMLFNYTSGVNGNTSYPTLYNSSYHNTGTDKQYITTKKIKGVSAIRIFGQNYSTYGFSKIYVNDVLHGYMYQYNASTIRTSFDYEIIGLDTNTEYVIKMESIAESMLLDCMDFMGEPIIGLDKGDQVPLTTPFTGWNRIHCSNSLLYKRDKIKWATGYGWESTALATAIGGTYFDVNTNYIGNIFTRKKIKGITAFSIIGLTGPTWTGSADVYLNDEKIGVITQSDTVITERRILFYKSGLDVNTAYSIRVEVTLAPFNINAIEGLGTLVYDTTLPIQGSAYSATPEGWTQYLATSDFFSYFSEQWETVNSSKWLNNGKAANYTIGQCFYTSQFTNVSGVRIYATSATSGKLNVFVNGEFIELSPVTTTAKGLVFEILDLNPSNIYQISVVSVCADGFYIYHAETLGVATIVSNEIKYPLLRACMKTTIPGWVREDFDSTKVEKNGTWANGNYDFYYAGNAYYTTTVGSYKQMLVKGVSDFIIYSVGNSDRVDNSMALYVDGVLVTSTIIQKPIINAVVGCTSGYIGTLDASVAHKIKLVCISANYTQPDAMDIAGPKPEYINLNAIGILVKNANGYIMKYNVDTKAFDATTDKEMMDDKYVYSKSFITETVMPLVMELPPLERYTLEVYDLSNVTTLGVLYEGENWVSDSIFKDELPKEVFGDIEVVTASRENTNYLPNDVIYGTSFFAHKIIDDMLQIPNVKETCDVVPAEIRVTIPIINNATYDKSEISINVTKPNTGIHYTTSQEEYVFIQGLSEARADFFLSTTDAEGTKFRVKDIVANIDDFIEIKFDTAFDTVVCPDFLTVNSDNSAISGILIVSGTFIITGTKEGSNFTVNLTVNKLKRIM